MVAFPRWGARPSDGGHFFPPNEGIGQHIECFLFFRGGGHKNRQVGAVFFSVSSPFL